MVLENLSDAIFYVEKPKTPGYVSGGRNKPVTASTETKSNTSNRQKLIYAALMAMADLAHGEKVFKKCAACHSIVKGGKE